MTTSTENSARPAEHSIRLFKNDFMEALTHVHPIVPLLFWSPLVVVLYWRTAYIHELALLPVLGISLLGLVIWTLTEYCAHRFLFHYPARSQFGKWLVFMFHGVHHDAPRDKSRLVMPPAGAVILMAMFVAIFSVFVPRPWIEPFLAAFTCGYLIYDYIHYATHHFPMRNGLARYLKKYHMAHHFAGEERRFGVSSPLWDYIFGTAPTEPGKDA